MFSFTNFLLMVFGLFVFFTKITQAATTLSLYFDRPYISTQQFVNRQKTSDLFAASFSFLVAINGIILTIESAYLCLEKYQMLKNNTLLSIITFLLLICSIVISFYFKQSQIYEEKTKIKKQWDTQKKITEFNDDEVRLYRQLKECNGLSHKLLLINIFNMFLLF